MVASPNASLSSYPGYVSHVYHAEAFVLRGKIEEPIQQEIEPIGLVKLQHTRRNTLLTQAVGETSIEGVISFKRGHTRVIGTQVQQKNDIFGRKHDGFATLATAVIEGYNVIDMVTAERVVAQLTTEHLLTDNVEHPIENVPRVNFLGTNFTNFRIGGFPVEIELDLNFCGPKPQKDVSYLGDVGFLDRVQRQIDSVTRLTDLPAQLKEDYAKEVTCIDEFKKLAKEGQTLPVPAGGDGPKLRFSLVKSIKLPTQIPGVFTFGNQIYIEDYGIVSLADVEVGIHYADNKFERRKGDPVGSGSNPSTYFKLLMIETKMGCAYKNGGGGGGVSGNGTTYP
jgi:hypothetical protein